MIGLIIMGSLIGLLVLVISGILHLIWMRVKDFYWKVRLKNEPPEETYYNRGISFSLYYIGKGRFIVLSTKPLRILPKREEFLRDKNRIWSLTKKEPILFFYSPDVHPRYCWISTDFKVERHYLGSRRVNYISRR